jgi:hypothetical protein
MDADSQKKVRVTCAHITLLMEHQEILPDLKDIVRELESDSDEYLKGAHDALNYLIDFLAQKGH